MIELLSYNVQYGKNLPQIHEWIVGFSRKPDIVCFQEFPQDAIKGKPLGNSYGSEFAAGLVKVGNTYGELTAYNHESVQLLRSKALDLGVSGLERKLFAHSGQRSALLTTMEVNGHELMIANIHLLWLAVNSKRRNQLEVVLAAIGDTHCPAIVVGDFNYTDAVAGNGLAQYMKDNGFQQSKGKLVTHRFLGIRHQLDYIFQKNLILLEVRTESVPFSDHTPIIAKVEFS